MKEPPERGADCWWGGLVLRLQSERPWPPPSPGSLTFLSRPAPEWQTAGCGQIFVWKQVTSSKPWVEIKMIYSWVSSFFFFLTFHLINPANGASLMKTKIFLFNTLIRQLPSISKSQSDSTLDSRILTDTSTASAIPKLLTIKLCANSVPAFSTR